MVLLGTRLVLVGWAEGGDECSPGVGESPFACVFNWGEPRCFSFSLLVFIAQTRGEEQVEMSIRWEEGTGGPAGASVETWLTGRLPVLPCGTWISLGTTHPGP